MRVFLTGASGVIGQRALTMLLARGHHITAATRPGSARQPAVSSGVTTVALDIFDTEAARRVMTGHDAVINLATRVPTGSIQAFLPGAWSATARIRRDASRALTLAARAAGVPRFIQESFAPIYEDAGDRWIDEASAVRPARYNRTVLDAERAVQQFSDDGGTGVVLRFGIFYGDDDPFTRMAIDSIRRGWVPFFGRPDGYLALIHHEDAAAAAVDALAIPGGIYNAVDNAPLTRCEFGDAVAAILNVKSPRSLPSWTTRLGGSVGETISRSLRISNKKLRDAVTWIPRYPSAREGWRVAARPRRGT